MQEVLKILIGIGVLALGIPIGNILAKYTQEELKERKGWFTLLIFVSLAIGIVGMIIKDDALMFSMFFIALVTSRSLRYTEKKEIKNKKVADKKIKRKISRKKKRK